MRFVYLVLVTLLQHISSIAAAVNTTSTNLQHQDFNRDEILDKEGLLRPELIEKDFDVLYAALDKLTLLDLINVGATNSRIAFIARAVFYQKYGDYRVILMEHFNDWAPVYDDLIVDTTAKRIEIQKLSLALKMFQRFGRVIKALSIFDQFSKDILESIRTPKAFEGVEDLFIGLKQNTSDVLPLNSLFPNLKALILFLQLDVNSSMFDCVLPNLKCLNVHLWNNAWNQRHSIIGLINKNPQIKSFEMYGFPPDYIKFINQALPSLENVTLFTFSTGNETVTLQNVKHLRLRGKYIKTSNDHWVLPGK